MPTHVSAEFECPQCSNGTFVAANCTDIYAIPYSERPNGYQVYKFEGQAVLDETLTCRLGHRFRMMYARSYRGVRVTYS